MTITLTGDRLAAAEKQAADAGFETVQEYLDWLFMPEAERQRRLAELRASIAEADAEYARGESILMTPDFIEEIKARGRSRLAGNE